MQNETKSETTQGLSWNLSQVFLGFNDPQLLQAQQTIQVHLQEFAALTHQLTQSMDDKASSATQIDLVCRLIPLRRVLKTSINDLSTWAYCLLSIDSNQPEIRKIYSQSESSLADLKTAGMPLDLFFMRAEESTIQELLTHSELTGNKFYLKHLRNKADFMLSIAEEQLLAQFANDGQNAWTNMYDSLSSALQCIVEEKNQPPKTLGMTQAVALLANANPETRLNAWNAISQAWKTQEEPCASALNALAGWRLLECKTRSHKRTAHFLDTTLHDNYLSKPSLDCMMSVVDSHIETTRRSVALSARAFGQTQLHPWDLFAPAPKMSADDGKTIPLVDALTLCEKAFSRIDPEMGEFVQLMIKNGWVDARQSERRRMGAYQAEFFGPRFPVIFSTYNGNLSSVKTLAHELGHAFHFWMMRNLPLEELAIPMAVAETASTLAEAALGDYILETATDQASKIAISWAEIRNIEAFLLNVPARFHFEKSFYEKRASGALAPAELSDLMTQSWQHYYGDTLTEMNPQFWQSKLHFYKQEKFYNWPYTFGYLFSLGIYAQREKLGNQFFESYKNLLRDAGRMTADELATKHMNTTLSQPEFWMGSLGLVKKKLDAFEKLAFNRES